MSDDRAVATPSQTVGPFFHIGLTPDDRLHVVAPLEGGERIQLVVTVIDGEGRPVPDAVVELWQAGAFGRMGTRADGTCRFDTVRPAMSADRAAARQAPHVNVCLFARGLLRHLHTRIYFPGDSPLDADPVLALVPEERRHTLLACADEGQPACWHFRVCLQGPGETVFFDA